MINFLKTYALFISMMIGIVFHFIFVDVSFVTKYFMDEPLKDITFITKYMLFLMLLIVYCKVDFRQFKWKRWHVILLTIQFTVCMLFYLLVFKFDQRIAEGGLICLLAPTATSAPVITGLLGGTVAGLITYSVSSNLLAAFFAPLYFSLIGAHGTGAEDLSFFEAFLIICQKAFPLIFGPFICALFLKRFIRPAYDFLRRKQGISFWLWTIALVLLMSRTTADLLAMDPAERPAAFNMALVALLCCLAQFTAGRKLGKLYHNKVASGQAYGQKNTILAIWMAQTFFNPVVAIAPATYVLWQNLVNSYQLSKHRRGLRKDQEN